METFLLGVLSASLITFSPHSLLTQDQNNYRGVDELSVKLSASFKCSDITTKPNLAEQIYFSRGEDDIGLPGAAKLEPLVKLLRKRQSLQVELIGFADPEGTDEYNNVLSHYRTLSVKQHLQALGISSKRITYSSYGASCSRAKTGDLSACAKERRVDIYLYKNNRALAYKHLSKGQRNNL